MACIVAVCLLLCVAAERFGDLEYSVSGSTVAVTDGLKPVHISVPLGSEVFITTALPSYSQTTSWNEMYLQQKNI